MLKVVPFQTDEIEDALHRACTAHGLRPTKIEFQGEVFDDGAPAELCVQLFGIEEAPFPLLASSFSEDEQGKTYLNLMGEDINTLFQPIVEGGIHAHLVLFLDEGDEAIVLIFVVDA